MQIYQQQQKIFYHLLQHLNYTGAQRHFRPQSPGPGGAGMAPTCSVGPLRIHCPKPSTEPENLHSSNKREFVATTNSPQEGAGKKL